MPELYGNAFKSELRRQIREQRAEICDLRTELWDARKAHRTTSGALRYAQCEIEELKTKIQRIEQKAKELAGDATLDDVEANTKERFIQSLRPRRAA